MYNSPTPTLIHLTLAFRGRQFQKSIYRGFHRCGSRKKHTSTVMMYCSTSTKSRSILSMTFALQIKGLLINNLQLNPSTMATLGTMESGGRCREVAVSGSSTVFERAKIIFCVGFEV